MCIRDSSAAARWSKALEPAGTDLSTRIDIDDIRELQLRVGYQFDSSMSIELVGRNLINDGAVDFYDRTQLEPSKGIPAQLFLRLRIRR